MFSIKMYEYLKTKVPNLNDYMDTLASEDATYIAKLGNKVSYILRWHICAYFTSFAQMTSAAGQIRHSHKSDMKKERTDFYLKLADGRPITPPIDSTTKPAKLGFGHPLTARALVPIKDLAAFDIDPETYADQCFALPLSLFYI
jgi:hypothetical protein